MNRKASFMGKEKESPPLAATNKWARQAKEYPYSKSGVRLQSQKIKMIGCKPHMLIRRRYEKKLYWERLCTSDGSVVEMT